MRNEVVGGGKSVARLSRRRPGRRGHCRILRNKLGGLPVTYVSGFLRNADGGHDEAFNLALDVGFFVVLLAARILAYRSAETLELGKGFVEGTLGGSAVAEGKSQSGGVESFEIEDGEFELEGATHAPLAEGHLLKQHALGFGGGFPFLVELGKDGVKFFEIGTGKFRRA